MNRFRSPVHRWLAVGVVTAGAAAGPLLASHTVSAAAHDGRGRARILVSSPPPGSKGPDDITAMAGEGDHGGHAVIWTAYQNGIGPDGSPAGAQSTVAGYDAHSGRLVTTISVTGKVDGLTADPRRDRLIATVNEDRNSALDVIDVATATVTTYAYSPSPETSDNGGTDSIAVWGDGMFLAHSNPNDTTQPAMYAVALDGASHTAALTPLYFCDSSATDAVTGAAVTLALTDPDTNLVMPADSPRFAGQLALISQGDGQMVFASGDTSPALSVLNLADKPTTAFPSGEHLPPIDGLAVATADHGTLYAVDAAAGTITALDTKGWKAGTVFVGEPSDTGNPLVGTLDLSTGTITPLPLTFSSPKGLLFLPAGGDPS